MCLCCEVVHCVVSAVTRWQDVTVEGLKKDLTDMHCHVRVIAIATCASGAVNQPSPELNPSEEGKSYLALSLYSIWPNMFRIGL